MAKSEHLQIIKQGVEAWNAWKTENPGVRPNLFGADLREADLGGANLIRADLKCANLSRVNLRAAHLSQADLREATLSKANLTSARISDADLSKAKLQGANLTLARIIGANISSAYLGNSNLSGADLSSANLRDADLVGAVLRGTDLRDCDLRRADFRGTNFSQARFGFTIFGDNDLSGVIGLETAIHLGPSTIGVDTLFKSDGKIPKVFLRGVGLPEVFITYLPSLIVRPIEFYSCFISYSHVDRSFARRLHDALQGRGIRCWLDEHELLPGDKIYTEVDRGIRLWDKILLCCSKEALTSWWVDNEIKIAFDKEQQLWRQRGKEVLSLIPLNLDDYLFSGQWQSGLATEVKARLAANFGGWEHDNKRFEEQFERLVKALRTDTRGKEPPPRSLL
jgi:uncharacterized protein YjbI with pentapeptide repeats